jgi:hypothetical protein
VKKSEKERQEEAKMKAQDRGTGATPAAGAKHGAIQGTFTTSDAIPWKPVDPKRHTSAVRDQRSAPCELH